MHADELRRAGIVPAARDDDEDRKWQEYEEATSRAHARFVAGQRGEDPWGERQELPPELPAVPTLPASLLPHPLREWLVDIAGRASIPLEYVAAPALVGLGALVGRGVGIRPGRYDDWLVVPNLWGGIIGRPGSMKSTAVAEALKPIHRLAAAATQRFEDDQLEWESRSAQLKAEADAIKKKMAKAASKSGDMESLKNDLSSVLRDLRDEAPRERRYVTQDATVEKLGELLKENPKGLLVFRDELAGWLRTMDKAGREGDREFYLEAWNGDGGYTFDRIGRGTVHVPSVCLSVCGGIQPGKLRAYIRGAMGEGEGDDGLLQRLQLLVWPDSLGEWRNIDRWPNTEAKRKAFAVYEWIDRIGRSKDPSVTFGTSLEGHHDEIASDDIPALRFDKDAQATFDVWRNRLEERLRSEELADTPAFESHLAKYRSLAPSLALVFHLVESSETEHVGPVSLSALNLAIEWCGFLEKHARKVYADELDPATTAAHALAAKITGGAVKDGDSVRELYRPHWSGLSDPDAVAAALQTLEGAGWIQVHTVDTNGRPSQVIHLHPDLRGAACA